MDIRELKNDVKAVVDYLTQSGIEVQHTVMLEAISRGFGERTWLAHREALAALGKSAGVAKVASTSSDTPTLATEWQPASGAMTDPQYIARSGARCPRCGSSDVESGAVKADGKTGWASVKCKTCNATWSDSWTLSGYFDLTVADGASLPLQAEAEFVSEWDGGVQIASRARISLETGYISIPELVEGGDVTTLDREFVKVANIPGIEFSVVPLPEGYFVDKRVLKRIRRLLTVDRPERTVDGLTLAERYTHVQGTLTRVFDNGNQQSCTALCLLANGALDFREAPPHAENVRAKVVERIFYPSAVDGETMIKDEGCRLEDLCLRAEDWKRLCALVVKGVAATGVVDLAAVLRRTYELDALPLAEVSNDTREEVEALNALCELYKPGKA